MNPLLRAAGAMVRAAGLMGPVGSPRRERLERLLPYYYALARPSFTFQGRRHRYLCAEYNKTWTNERAVEIPLARAAMAARPGARLLEVGNVLNHYGPFPHDVVDKYERAPGVVNADAVDFVPRQPYDLIVSVSTLEHVGWDEQPREPAKVERAITHLLRRCLAPGGTLFMTVPLGYNAHLDALLRDGKLPLEDHGFLRRVSVMNEWREATWEEVRGVPYRFEMFSADAILAATLRREPLG